MSIGADFLLASGYTGQTTETLALPTDPLPFERIVGVPLKSYVSVSWTYYFKKWSPWDLCGAGASPAALEVDPVLDLGMLQDGSNAAQHPALRPAILP